MKTRSETLTAAKPVDVTIIDTSLKPKASANRKRKLDQISSSVPPANDPVPKTYKKLKTVDKIKSSAIAINDAKATSDQNQHIQSAIPAAKAPKLSRANSKKNKEEQKQEESKNDKDQGQLSALNQNADQLYKNISKFFVPKPFTQLNDKFGSLTKYIEVTVLELLNKVKEEEINNHRKKGEEENCPICMCELYENLEKMSEQEIKEMHEKQIKQELPIDVVVMSKCTDHCYHKECLVAQMGQQECIRCAVCSQIYGVLTGGMPKGTMSWKLTPKNKNYYCDGYKDVGVWEIRYDFPDGTRNGVKYQGTRRRAYIPDIPEGKEVLTLLVKSFERRLSFLVGTSVTTGQQNCVIWNVHHKTNTHGGSSCFGYPDPTYLNRVKLELADRGVFLENIHEIEAVTLNGNGQSYVN